MNIFRKKKFMTIGSEINNKEADLSDIDLTSATCDSRLAFSCASSRAYYAVDGTIKYAKPNIWPLEYKNGIAIGRHEPEPQATNYNIYVKTLNKLSSIVGAEFDYYSLPLFFCNFPAGRDRYIQCLTTLAGAGIYTVSHYSLYDSVLTNGKTAIGRPISYGMVAPGLDRQFSVNLETGGTSTPTGTFLRTAAQRFHDGYRCIGVISTDSTLTQLAYRMMIAVTNVTLDTDTTQIIGMPQVETGAFATSPIITSGSAATRAAAFASIKNPGGVATAVRVFYTDGTVALLEFNGATDVDIPYANSDWGTRYISKCEYLKS
ncbi:TPA: phage head spike fiber domain-containing protein [Escherichia coli]